MPPTGVGLRFTPAGMTHGTLRDWLFRQARAADALEAVSRSDAAIGVHWPTFLRGAFVANDAYAVQALRLWQQLAPFFRAQDPILAEYVLRYSRTPKTQEFLDSLSLHVEALFASALGRRIWRALRTVASPVVDKGAAERFMRCIPCLSAVASLRPAPERSFCPACCARDGLAEESLLIDIKHVLSPDLGVRYVRGFTPHLKPSRPPRGARVVQDMHWMLAGRHPYDGAVVEGTQVTVDFTRYAERLADSVLGLDDPALWPAALAQRTVVSADQLRSRDAVNVGFLVQDAVMKHVDSLKVSELRRAVAELTSTEQQMRLKALRETASRRADGMLRPRNRQHQVYEQAYATGEGSVTVGFRKYGGKWLIRAPIVFLPAIRLPKRVRRQRLVDPAAPEFWWMSTDLLDYGNLLAAKGFMREADEVRNLHAWCVLRIELFRTNPAVLARLRAEAKQDASRAVTPLNPAGVPKLGPFTQREVQALRTFLYQRTETPIERAFRGPFTDDEWARLELAVPYRSRESLLRKTVDLGFEYAKEFGYVAYLKSGFGVAKSSARRAAWLAKGVKV